MNWTWIPAPVVRAIHEEQLAEHGGRTGLRDPGLLDSTLARPRNLLTYGKPDAAALAAAYAFGLAKNHPFVDGNKRMAAIISRLFLRVNGHDVRVTESAVVVTFLALAAGNLSEEELAQWFRDHLVRLK